MNLRQAHIEIARLEAQVADLEAARMFARAPNRKPISTFVQEVLSGVPSLPTGELLVIWRAVAGELKERGLRQLDGPAAAGEALEHCPQLRTRPGMERERKIE
jgi:hypothetical protein